MAIVRKTVAVLAVAMLSAASVSAARALLDGGYCDWGGFDNPKYPWAKPRDERDWYCGNTAFFNSEAQGAADSGTPIQFAIYGDSIMQCLRWQGEFCKNVDGWFEDGWGAKYNAKSWALGSETSGTLFWRMLNGDGLLKQAGTKVALLYIGSNNFGQGDQDEEGQRAVADELIVQVRDMARWMMDQSSDLHVILLGLMPKTGYENGRLSFKVNSATWKAVQQYNGKLRAFGEQEERVRYVECNDAFLKDDGVSINKNLMIDGLHPNLDGFKVLASCIDPFLQQYLGNGNPSSVSTSSGG